MMKLVVFQHQICLRWLVLITDGQRSQESFNTDINEKLQKKNSVSTFLVCSMHGHRDVKEEERVDPQFAAGKEDCVVENDFFVTSRQGQERRKRKRRPFILGLISKLCWFPTTAQYYR